MTLQFTNTTALRPGLLAGRLNYPGHSLTLIVKGTFDLAQGHAAATCEGQMFPTGDEFYSDDEEARGGPLYSSDFAHYKSHADLLLVGKCHTPGGKPTSNCDVRFQVGDRSKTLTVLGNRNWFRKRMRWQISEPEPFTEMELRYENSFGGAKSKRNPVGKGAAPTEDEEGFEARPLPNIEDPSHLVESPRSRPQPAGFGPLNQTWETRQAKMGTYKGNYLETRWPWFPEDFDWTHFNAAPEDMQLEGYLRGDEKLYFENLHKEHAQYHSQLPGIRVRCFVNRLKGPDSPETEFIEVPLALDTLWVDMEADKLVLVWRGWTEVADEDHEEIKDVFITSEPLAQRPASVDECYQQFLQAQAEEEGEPIEPEAPAEGEAEQAPDTTPPEEPGPRIDAAFLKAQTNAILVQMGVDPEQMPPEAKQKQDELIDRIAETDPDKIAARELKQAKQQMREQLAKLDLDLDNLPPLSAKAKTEQARFMKELGIKPSDVAATPELASLFAVVSAVTPKFGMDPEDLSPLIDQVKKHGLAVEGEEGKEEEESDEKPPAPLTREEVQERAARSESFAETDLKSLDLSDLELSGLDFSGAVLSGVNLTGTKLVFSILEGADLSAATLTGADLTGANMAEADLTKANLERACLESADCTSSNLTQATLTGAKLSEATFEQARLAGAVLNEVEAKGTYFVEADLRGTKFRKAKCSGADFSKATLDKADFKNADLSEASAEGAVGHNIRCIGADLTKFRGSDGSDFSKGIFYKAICPESLWEDANLTGSDFRGSQLQGAQFTGASLDQSHMSACDARRARFSKASLRQAEMDHMNLFQGSLEKADLTEANLTASNMYGVEFLGAIVDETQLVDTNVKMTKLAEKG